VHVQALCSQERLQYYIHLDRVQRIAVRQHSRYPEWVQVMLEHTDGAPPFYWVLTNLDQAKHLADALRTLAAPSARPAPATP
jgi:hypothetical protein